MLAVGVTALFGMMFGTGSQTAPAQIVESAPIVQLVQQTPEIASVGADAVAVPERTSTTPSEHVPVVASAPVVQWASPVSATSGVGEDELTQKLQGLESRLRGVISQAIGSTAPVYTPVASGGIWNSVAGTNRIDQLTGTVLTNVTVHGISGLTTADLPDFSGSYFPATSTISVAYGGTGTSTAPTYGKLLVGNAFGGYSLMATSSLGISGGSSQWTTSGSDVYYSTGKVGIGTTTPQTELTIANTAGVAGLNVAGVSDQPNWMNVGNYDGTSVAGNWALNLGYSGGMDQFFNGTAQGDMIVKAYSYNNDKKLFLGASGGGIPGMVFAPGGNVGIGTVSPWAQLTVAGSAPTLKSTISSQLSGPYTVYVQGNYAYVASFTNSQLVIYDVSSTASPALVGYTSNGLSSPTDVVVQGKYAYVTNSGSGRLVVVDISDPAAPTTVGFVSGVGGQFVRVQGRYAYVSGGISANQFSIVDISKPTAPVVAAAVTSNISRPEGLAVSGHYVFLTSLLNSKLFVYDVSNPTAPVEVANTSTQLSYPYGVTVSGRYAYVLDDTQLVIYDISNPISPAVVGHTTTGLSSPVYISVQGHYAYIVNYGNSTFAVLDISDPTLPSLVSTTGIGSGGRGIFVAGRYVYTASGGGLRIHDLGGAYIQQGEFGGLSAGSLAVNDAFSANDGAFLGGLTVGHSLNVSGTAAISATTSTGQAFSVFSINNATGTAPIFTAFYNGSIGIGTTTPSAMLAVAGNAYATGGLGVGMVNSVAGSIRATATTTALNFLASDNGAVGTPAYAFSNALNTGIYAVGSNNLRFSANGVNGLTVTDSQVYTPLSGNAAGPAFSFGAANLGFFSPSANVMGFSTGGNERMRLDSAGNLAIATTSAAYTLDVFGIGNFANYARASYFTATSTTLASTFPYASSTALTVSGNAFFAGSGIWTSGGAVGIGTTTPAASLTVSGGISTDSTAFATAGTGYTYTVPAGVTQLVVKTWGAGGGAGYTNSGRSGGAGGGGGFAQATITVTPGETLLIDVGGGGGGTTSSASGSGGTNGGGSGGSSGSSGATSGGGGGYSAVRRSSTMLVQAGAGGGGGNGMSSGSAGGAGGAGGGSTGSSGGNAGGTAGGSGGTSSAGGAGGGDPQNWCGSHSSGGAGSLNQGGNGLSLSFCNEVGAGGGGGHYGGGGGSVSFSGGGGGGGGGSDLVTGTNTIEMAGSGSAAANTSDPDYGGTAGVGGAPSGTNGAAGAAGRVVISTVSTAAVQFTNSSAASIATFLGSGYSGIGTTTPWGKLSVLASDNATAPQFVVASSTVVSFLIDKNGNVGMATTSPDAAMTIYGNATKTLIHLVEPDSAPYPFLINNLTYGFGISSGLSIWQDNTGHAIVQTGGSGGVIMSAGGTSWSSNSDQRLKTDIETLNATSGLDAIMQLHPVTFSWKDAMQAGLAGKQLGFIAQEVGTIFPGLITTTGTTTIRNADGTTSEVGNTLALNYTGLIPPLVQAVQDIANLSETFKGTLIAWLADASNGISKLFAHEIYADKLCAKDSAGTYVCVTGDQLAASLGGQVSSPTPSDSSTATPATPPTIAIIGNDPANIDIGATYSDLGAAITGPTSADRNLGIQTYVGNTPIEQAFIDTSAPATYHINYVAQNAAGISTSTRTVIVGAVETSSASTASETSSVPTDATSTDDGTGAATVSTQ